MRPLGAIVLLAIYSVGCQREDTPDPIIEFYRRYAEISCPGVVSCCAAAAVAHDVGRCKADLVQFGGIASEVAKAGATKMDAATAEECLAALPASFEHCPPAPVPDACERVFAGSVPKGGKCFFSIECQKPKVGTAHCVERQVDGNAARYGCQHTVPAQDGEACGSVSDPWLYAPCEPEDALYCDNTVCRPRLPPGTACNDARQCAAGSGCGFVAASGAYECMPRVPVGALCTYSECADDAYCGDAAVCEPKKEFGQPCATTAECLAGSCNGTCTLWKVCTE